MEVSSATDIGMGDRRAVRGAFPRPPLTTRIYETGSTGVFETGDVAHQQNKDQPMFNEPPAEANTQNAAIHTAAD